VKIVHQTNTTSTNVTLNGCSVAVVSAAILTVLPCSKYRLKSSLFPQLFPQVKLNPTIAKNKYDSQVNLSKKTSKKQDNFKKNSGLEIFMLLIKTTNKWAV
jgi:hypothetical protein